MSTMRDWLKVQLTHALATPPVRALSRAFYSGSGVIFTLHRVVEHEDETLIPGIAITTVFLLELLEIIHRQGREIIPLSEVPNRLHRKIGARRWACLTFDDGFLDNLTLASPILTRLGVPYTLFVVSDWVTRRSVSCSALLERLVMTAPEVRFVWDGQEYRFKTVSRAQKLACYTFLDLLRWRDPVFDSHVPSLVNSMGISISETMSRLFLDSASLASIRADGCCEIGSHTKSHRPLAHLNIDDAQSELADSRSAIGALLSRAPDMIAYPYGSRDQCSTREFSAAAACGYRIGVTTRTGNIFAMHEANLLALPRTGLSLHPHGHCAAYVLAALDGSRNAFMNQGRRMRD
jgi:peptidoglycan/xylan/chitin deacetylase (PgdA/CDA1 family)